MTEEASNVIDLSAFRQKINADIWTYRGWICRTSVRLRQGLKRHIVFAKRTQSVANAGMTVEIRGLDRNDAITNAKRKIDEYERRISGSIDDPNIHPT